MLLPQFRKELVMNYVVIVGRIDDIIEVTKKQIDLVISVSYKTDNEPNIKRKARVNVYNTIAENVMKYCKPSDVISVKGFIDMDIKDNNIIVAEQISFMSSTPQTK